MVNLLRADFFRVLRTKIVYISLIIAIVLPIFVEGVTALTEAAAKSVYPEYVSTGAGNQYLLGSFSPVMGFSFIFAVFPVIVIMMDFGNGTIRNKVIHGYTRHQIFAAHFIVGIALFLSSLAQKGMKVSELRKTFPNYFIAKNRIDLTPSTDVDAILEKVKEMFKDEQVNDIDGVKIDFPDKWVHLRKSNTEPIIRVYSEAHTMDEADALGKQIMAIVYKMQG